MSSRSRPTAGVFRGSRRRIGILMLVVAIITLLGAALFAALAPFANSPQSEKLYLFAAYFGAAGLLILLLRFFLFVFPYMLESRRSPSRRLRREQSAVYNSRRDKRHTPPSPKNGSVLILLLILVGLIAALLLQTHALTRARSARQSASQERTRLRLAATEAARGALQRLADDEDLTVDTTNEVWAARVEEESPIGIATRVSVRDEQSRFDLNNLAATQSPGRRTSEDIVLDLQTLCGDFSPSARTIALRDFVDENSNGSRESDFYRRLNPPSACPDRALYGWHEMLNVDGWTEEQLARRPRESSMEGFDASLVDHVTLIPEARTHPIPINVNTASRETLRAVMGIDQDALVNTILALREIRPIRQLDVFSVTAGPETFDRLRPYLDVRSQYFRVRAQAEQEGRHLDLDLLVKREGDGRVHILQWLEDPS